MEIIKRKFAEAKVFTDDMGPYAGAQLQMICDNPVSEGRRIRVMPDIHPGKVGTIGLTMTVRKKVIPQHLGKEVTDFYMEKGAKILKRKGLEVPYPMTWLEGQLMEDYINDVKIVQEYAQLNREIIIAEIIKGTKLLCSKVR